MKQTAVFDRLNEEGLISEESLKKNKLSLSAALVSLHWDIRTLLYTGVSIFVTGVGTLLYKNIDTIGHQVILMLIAAITACCFYYCFRLKPPYSAGKVISPNAWFDYVLLLGCCMLLAFLGYLQYQYTVFGSSYGLALFIPMLVLFFCAYYFDHLGILSMAIVNLGAWLGVSITPLHLLTYNDFNSNALIFTGIGLGLLLLGLAYASTRQKIKAHFAFTYANFGVHVALVSLLSALFQFDRTYLLWALLLGMLAALIYREALRQQSFYFVLVITVYSYIGFTYLVVRVLELLGANEAIVYLGFLYFIFSGIGLVLFLINTNRKIKARDSLQP